VPISDPEAASQPPTGPTQPAAIEVDQPTPKGTTPEELVPSTIQEQLNQTAAADTQSVEAWLEAPSLSLEGLPDVEIVYP